MRPLREEAIGLLIVGLALTVRKRCTSYCLRVRRVHVSSTASMSDTSPEIYADAMQKEVNTSEATGREEGICSARLRARLLRRGVDANMSGSYTVE